mmetsp:Transcript_50982/g.95420  ORF Transcript_50982/g.95420 Transcript_50982/m.95420 type:complete len:281 (-) Transcript_50982:77-919(-)
MPVCEDEMTQTPPLGLSGVLQASRNKLTEAVQRWPLLSIVLSALSGGLLVSFGGDTLFRASTLFRLLLVAFTCLAPAVLITVLVRLSGLFEEVERDSHSAEGNPEGANLGLPATPSAVKWLPFQRMDGTNSELKSIWNECQFYTTVDAPPKVNSPLRCLVFYHTVDASAGAIAEVKRLDALAGESDFAGKIILCNTESLEKAIYVSKKLSLRNALHVHGLMPRGAKLPRFNPLKVLVDESGRILKSGGSVQLPRDLMTATKECEMSSPLLGDFVDLERLD